MILLIFAAAAQVLELAALVDRTCLCCACNHQPDLRRPSENHGPLSFHHNFYGPLLPLQTFYVVWMEPRSIWYSVVFLLLAAVVAAGTVLELRRFRRSGAVPHDSAVAASISLPVSEADSVQMKALIGGGVDATTRRPSDGMAGRHDEKLTLLGGGTDAGGGLGRHGGSAEA